MAVFLSRHLSSLEFVYTSSFFLSSFELFQILISFFLTFLIAILSSFLAFLFPCSISLFYSLVPLKRHILLKFHEFVELLSLINVIFLTIFCSVLSTIFRNFRLIHLLLLLPFKCIDRIASRKCYT